jgi:predicted DNA binding CopG/RHH family protein
MMYNDPLRKAKRLDLRMTETHLRFIERQASVEGISRPEYVRNLIVEAMRRMRTAR